MVTISSQDELRIRIRALPSPSAPQGHRDWHMSSTAIQKRSPAQLCCGEKEQERVNIVNI